MLQIQGKQIDEFQNLEILILLQNMHSVIERGCDRTKSDSTFIKYAVKNCIIITKEYALLPYLKALGWSMEKEMDYSMTKTLYKHILNQPHLGPELSPLNVQYNQESYKDLLKFSILIYICSLGLTKSNFSARKLMKYYIIETK